MTPRWIIVVGLLCLIASVGAMVSLNYGLGWSTGGSGGGAMASASYRMDGTVGLIADTSSSASYTIHSGFWLPDRAGPTVTSITPDSGAAGSTVIITDLVGTGFSSGATVMIGRSGTETVPATDVVVVSPSRITCRFALPLRATPGAWTVVVTNPDGQTAKLEKGFTVTAPGAPTISSITPTSGQRGTTVTITNLAGTGFIPGATVRLSRSGSADIEATVVEVVSPTLIRGQISLPATAATGSWTVVVVNPDNQGAQLVNGFTITTPPPTVSSIAPNSGRRGSMVAITNLAGTGFASGATVRLMGWPEVEATNVVVVSPTKITCTFDLPWYSSMDARNVTVTNPDGQTATLRDGFTVLPEEPPPHTVTGITPDQGTVGTTVTATIDGTRFGFGAPAYVWLQRGTDTIMATSVVVVSTTQITCQFALPSTAATGAWDVAVQTVGEIGYLRSGFTITAPVQPLPGGAGMPTDTDKDGKLDDINGNGRVDFADVVLYFNQMSWVAANEPIALFDYNANGRFDFADVVALFNSL